MAAGRLAECALSKAINSRYACQNMQRPGRCLRGSLSLQRSQSVAGFCAILDKEPCVDGNDIITATPRTGRGRYRRVHEKAGTRSACVVEGWRSGASGRMESGYARRENASLPWPKEDSIDTKHAATHLYDRFFAVGGTVGNGLPEETGGCRRNRDAGLAGANGDRSADAGGAGK